MPNSRCSIAGPLLESGETNAQHEGCDVWLRHKPLSSEWNLRSVEWRSCQIPSLRSLGDPISISELQQDDLGDRSSEGDELAP